MRRPYLKLKISASKRAESQSKQACSGPVSKAFRAGFSGFPRTLRSSVRGEQMAQLESLRAAIP
jgi:hypothetical protein